MTDNVARLFETNNQAAAKSSHDPQHEAPEAKCHVDEVDAILHLAELVPVVRSKLKIDDCFPDDAILAGLQAAAAPSDPRARWQAIFASNLGHWLALKTDDLHAALNTLLMLLPPPRS